MYDMEAAVKRTLHDIDDMEKVNAVLPIIKKVVTAWDGKVMNKRFEAALQDAGLPGRIYIAKNYETFWDVYYYPGESNEHYTVLHGAKPNCQYYKPENSFVTPEKRISAEQAFALIEAGRVDRLKKITAYKEHLETWKTKKEQIEILKKQIKTISESVPYALQDYFNMRVRYY